MDYLSLDKLQFLVLLLVDASCQRDRGVEKRAVVCLCLQQNSEYIFMDLNKNPPAASSINEKLNRTGKKRPTGTSSGKLDATFFKPNSPDKSISMLSYFFF